MSGRSCLLIQVQLTQLMSLRWPRQSAKTHKGSSVSGKLRLTFMWTMWRSHVVESQYRVFREGSQGWEAECRNKCPVCCSNNGICCYWASSIHPSILEIFFLWWWGHTSDKSPLNQIPGSLPGSVKRNSSGKTTNKTSHKYGRTMFSSFVRWGSIVLVSTQLYQTGLVRVSEFHASFLLRSLHSFSLFDRLHRANPQ